MDISRFFAKINKTGYCWLWTAYLDKDGYGKIIIKGSVKRAHRVSYELHKGRIPDGLYVLHKCNNRKCVNPEHLYTGTHQ